MGERVEREPLPASGERGTRSADAEPADPMGLFGSVTRLEALSDGVMAFAMTLLVLDLRTPALEAGSAAQLLGAVAAEWPSVLTLVTSFVYIGLYWVNHHHIYHHVRRVDHVMLLLNLGFLLSIVLVPFATSLLAEEFGKPGLENGAAVVYAGVGVLSAALFTGMWAYAAKRGFVDDALDAAVVRRIRVEGTFGIAWSALAGLVGVVSVLAAIAMFLLPIVFFAFPRGPLRATGT
jgi:uncharacterized membrane protein